MEKVTYEQLENKYSEACEKIEDFYEYKTKVNKVSKEIETMLKDSDCELKSKILTLIESI